MMRNQAVLLDIEGTTMPIRFVYETLFPLASQCAESFLYAHYHEPDVKSALEVLRCESVSDSVHGAPLVPSPNTTDFLPQALRYLFWLTERDRKSTALKIIQGRIWQEAFESGAVRSPFFPDVEPALQRWTKEGRIIAVYSSGSALAQRLAFRYTETGDLSGFISRYFDTTIGRKDQSQSYKLIANELAIDPHLIMFLSDSSLELDAAGDASLVTRLCIRPGNKPVAETQSCSVIHSFDEV